MEKAVGLSGISKRYLISHMSDAKGATLGETLTSTISSITSPSRSKTKRMESVEDFWALEDINFEIKKGERFGIIGPNGAGKSTLLKLIARITQPTDGWIGINGRVASLLEVGTGFHSELTGRENIYLNGAILGMSRREIQAQFDEIVAFSELEQFLDTPVKRYSSGMYVRLAFAVAAHLRFDILLVDEILAVGDLAFQEKCLGTMTNLVQDGKTVIFVSHDMGAVASLCSTGIVLQGGKLSFAGPIEECVSEYLNSRNLDSSIDFTSTENDNHPVRISNAQVVNMTQEPGHAFSMQEPISITYQLEVIRRTSRIYVAFHLKDSTLESVIFCRDFEFDADLLRDRDTGTYEFSITIPAGILTPGTYSVVLDLCRSSPGEILQSSSSKGTIKIYDNNSTLASVGFQWLRKWNAPVDWSQVTPPSHE